MASLTVQPDFCFLLQKGIAFGGLLYARQFVELANCEFVEISLIFGSGCEANLHSGHLQCSD